MHGNITPTKLALYFYNQSKNKGYQIYIYFRFYFISFLSFIHILFRYALCISSFSLICNVWSCSGLIAGAYIRYQWRKFIYSKSFDIDDQSCKKFFLDCPFKTYIELQYSNLTQTIFSCLHASMTQKNIPRRKILQFQIYESS